VPLSKAGIKIGVIGCGRIAGHHCATIVENPDLNLVAVCDLDRERAEKFSKQYEVPFYDNYRKMLNDHSEIDTVVVATPSGMHFEHTMEMLERFSKNVVVEKPTFMKPSQVQTAFRTAKTKNLQIYPVFQNRFNQAVQRVKEALNRDELGQIRIASVRVRWCRPQRYYDLSAWRGTFAMDGGALTNQGIHHIDLLRFLGGEVKNVKAEMRTFGADIEVEDTVVATIEYSSGAIGSLEITTAARPDDFEASISIVCSNGLAQIGGIAVNELQVFTPDPAECARNSQDFSRNVYGLGHGALYRSLVESRKGIAPYAVQEEDCLRSIALLHAFYVSNETKSTVSVEDRVESSRLGEASEKLAALYRLEEI
jgi:UDP-N-acetyl-2-amino-2-deoxyglucuronate dehydrogenase